MKIRLAILENDKNYLEAVCGTFEVRFSDKLEIYSFTDLSIALSSLKNIKIDVFLASEAFDIDKNALPERCAFAYLTENPGVSEVKGCMAVGKFQKADIIYKYILNIYSEKAASSSGIRLDDSSSKVIFFNSVCGGTGATSMAAAAAVHFAALGKKTMYLNLESYGSADLFFDGTGQFDMSDIIFALKSKKGALGLKIESCLKTSSSGVYYFSPPKVALDMNELEAEDIISLISELKTVSNFDYIIVDTNRVIDNGSYPVFCQAHSIIWVGDGSIISNNKIIRAYRALQIMDQNKSDVLSNRIKIVYNKFSNKIAHTIDDTLGIKSIGGVPRREHTEIAEIIDWLSQMTLFDSI